MIKASIGRHSVRTPGPASQAFAIGKPARMAPTVGNQARLRRLAAGGRPLQAKLTIGAINDPLEQEADAAADRVMRMADPRVSLSSAPTLARKCAACEEEEQELQREATGAGMAGAVAPPIVHDVLNSPGRPLDPATHDFMASRFGADFSDVRIHTDGQAARSAAAVGARAYTLGRDLVFGEGQFDPAGEGGRRLLAHELAHTLQQGGGAVKRAPCRSAAECATSTSGDTGAYVTAITPVQSANTAAITSAPPASPLGAQLALIGAPTPNIRSLMAANGLTLRSEVFGIFQSPRVEGNAGAQTNACSLFPNESAAGVAIRANPAAFRRACIEVPPLLEVRAGAVLGVVPPGTPAQRSERTYVLATIAHEMEHAHFNITQAATITPTADCTLSTIVRNNPDFPRVDHYRVGFYLSEIAAISNQFPAYFDNFIANDTRGDHRLLFEEERNEAFNPDEGIVGVVQGLRCVCSCASVNSLVTQTIARATADWTRRERLAYLRAMTRIMPSYWPPALVTPDGPE